MSTVNFLNQVKKGALPDFREQIYEGLRNPNEPHLAFLLLLDTSSSMGDMAGLKTKIQLLNEAIARLKDEMMMDELAASRVDIAIVAFSSNARVICNWTPLSHFMVKERRRFYQRMGTPSFQGHIFMITDGMPTDDTTALVQRIKEEESKGPHGKLKWFSCAVPGADEAFLASLSKRKVAVETTDFDKLFQWIGASLVITSVSNAHDGGAGTGTAVKLPDLPQGMRRIPDDW